MQTQLMQVMRLFLLENQTGFSLRVHFGFRFAR